MKDLLSGSGWPWIAYGKIDIMKRVENPGE